MWQKSAPEQTQQAPSEPNGRDLATFARPGGRFGPPTELRVTLSEFEGHPYVALRVWSKGPDGSWFPTRKGVSIKIRELENLAETLHEAARLIEAENPGAEQGPRRDTRRPGAAPRRGGASDRQQRGLPLAGSGAMERPLYSEDFDEFGG